MEPLPSMWNLATRANGNGHDVSGALEIAGDDIANGALVRAVPLRGDAGPVSVPGDTAWKNATGNKEIEKDGPPPPDIILNCIDGESSQQLHVTWDMSWSDVLDLLRAVFKRACVFSYDVRDPAIRRTVRRTVASEREFDNFCSQAERQENQADVYILDATFTPSKFIKDEPVAPTITNGEGEQVAMTIHHEKTMNTQEQDDEMMEVPRRTKTHELLTRLSDAPIPITHTIAFGVMGFFVSIAAVVLGYLDDLNTLGAVALALPVNIFMLSFFVSAVEDGPSSLVRLGVGFCGFFAALIVIICYSITQELVALGSAFLFLLASFYYLELNVRARGWTSWFQGLSNLFEWFRGGCPLVGVRQPEPCEDIILLGKEPPITFATALQTPEERHPGVIEWIEPEVGMTVKHVGTCLMDLSEKGNPMGPWGEGIIQRKTARQLRKWLVRNGKKKETDFEKWAALPSGKITYIGSIGTRVAFDNGYADYFETGENSVYELVLYQKEQVDAEHEKYKDGEPIHGGGSSRLVAQTFLAYFLRKFCSFFWYWFAFLSYFLLLYTFEFSLTNYAVFQATGAATYEMKGGLYNVGPGNDVTVHIYCKGPQQGGYDGRPPVIMESMEGVGQGIAMARLQDLIAERGVGCVYDRVGFGFSSDLEDTSVFGERTPERIVSQLHFALINGTNIENWRPVTWTRQGLDELNRTTEVFEPVRPPFIMLGHSAGGLYARLFAARYPAETAGLVLVDPLPAENDGIPSVQQKMLSPFIMTLCTRFLQPVGLIYTFFPSVVYSLFSEQTRYNLNMEGDPEPLNDFDQMTGRMFERQWCPAVLAEWYGLYSGDPKGIEVVAEADRNNYSVPTLIWVRDKNRLDEVTSADPIYEWEGKAKPVGGVSGNATASRRLTADECEECFSWEEVQLELLQHFEKSWINPFTAQRDIMRGDPASCAAAECTEYTPIENAREILDAVLDMWNTLRYNDPSVSSNWTFSLVRQEDAQGRIVFDEARFKCELAILLRHVGNRAINIFPIDYARADMAPFNEIDDCSTITPQTSPFLGYSGDPLFGQELYLPRNNKGQITFTVQLIGHKERAVGWAEDNLRATENSNLDSTAISRRTTFLHQWQVLALSETVCTTDIATAIETCTPTGVDLFSSEYASTAHLQPGVPEIYKCPQNTYQSERACLLCDLTKTSRPGSLAESDCFACLPIFDDQMETWRYYYLNCTGRGCAECPAGTLSSPGALGISDCRPVSGFTFFIKGPMDKGNTSQAVQPHRENRPEHLAFDALLFRTLLEAISGISLDRIVLFPGMPRDVPDFPASRCTQMRGGCMFQVGFSTQAESSEDLARATRYMLGQECYLDDHPVEQYPYCYGDNADFMDTNRTKRAARTELFSQFEIVSFFEQLTTGDDSGTCPAQLVNLSSSRSQVDFFHTEYIDLRFPYQCPSKFYKDRETPVCLPCPDMTTSDRGSIGVESCLPFDTLIMVGKDASLTYQARTNPTAGGLTEARPNALRLHNGDISYIKIRGYAVHIDELIDPTDEELGYQWSRCPIGLNCFDQSHLRFRVSELLLGKVKPNEVRLTTPATCSAEPPGLTETDSSAEVYTNMCGPWPGFPHTAQEGQCVCIRADPSKEAACFATGGRLLVGNLIGGELQSLVTGVGTAGECAKMAHDRLSTASFLYDPNTLECSVHESYVGQRDQLCPSTFPECIDRACAGSPSCPIKPGMQLYWADSTVNPTCTLEVETDVCLGSPQGRSPYPLDAFYMVVNLHAETATELVDATKMLTEGTPGATGRLERQRRAAFLREYQIISLMQSEDKAPNGEVGREQSLNFLIHSHFLTCTIAAGLCMGAFSDDLSTVVLAPGGVMNLLLGNAERTVLEAMISRIDITLESQSPENIDVDLLFEFSEGSSRLISLLAVRFEVFDDLLRRTHAFYIEPVVTRSVRITPIFRGLASVSIAFIDFRGQEMPSILRGQAVNLFQDGFVDGEYRCPPTSTKLSTLDDTTVKQCGLGEAEQCACVPCPYPLTSNLTGQGACACPACGDGRLNWQANEECDDGNVNELDGCSSTCKVENLQMCEGAKNEDTFVGLPIAMYDEPDFCLRLGSFWTPYGLAGWNSRYGTAAVVHRNALWIIAGIGNGAKQMYNDVWFEDTNGWRCIPAEPAESCVPASGGTDLVWGLGYPQTLKPNLADYLSIDIFAPRGFHGAVSMQGYIWVAGGIERSGWQQGATPALNCPIVPDGSNTECQLDSSFSDVWRTTGSADADIDINRVSWELVTANAGWASRGMHGFLVFQDTMWIIGGRQYIPGANKQVRTLSDVWSSTDGKDWSVATINPAWRSRAGHGATLDQDSMYMYITGGRHDDGSMTHYLNDVWRSADGITWTEVTAHAGWHGRWLHRSIVFQDSMWVIGGQRCGGTDNDGEFVSNTPCRRTTDATSPWNNYGDVWVSVNKGAHWDEATALATWNRRAGHALVVFDTTEVAEARNPRQNLWILGGMDGFDTAHNDTFNSFAF